ncbi:MAG TPA: hypothetical protein DDW87_03145 [Firmicutes bacterium]|nr:hypothetical protein [Bacillota bacterium]
MTGCFLGVDGGASKTRCVVTNFDGNIVSWGFGGCANKNITSFEGAVLEVRLAIMDALVKGGFLPGDIISAHCGLGGLFTDQDREAWLAGLQDLAPSAAITVDNDVFLSIPAADRAFGIAVVSGSGGNIGAITPAGRCHVNGQVNFHSAQLGRRALQALLWQIQIQKEFDPFGQALFDLANFDKEQFLESFHTQPEQLAREIAPYVSTLSTLRQPQAVEIVLAWLERVRRDVEIFQKENQLESLPVCFGGSTFTSLQAIILEHLKFPNGCLVSSLPLEEAAVKLARKQALARKALESH